MAKIEVKQPNNNFWETESRTNEEQAFTKDTQRFLSVEQMFRKPYSSQQFGINCDEKKNDILFSEMSP